MIGRNRAFPTLRVAMVACVVMVASAAWSLTPQVAAASTTNASPTVPSQQAALLMACAPGQIDLNHASAIVLQQLGVGAPTAQRIVDARPHDRIVDLLTVPGVGAGTVAAIQASGRACSTPLSLPPPAKNVCTSPQQIDVNNPGSLSQLSTLFGRPTAQRIVAAQPFPDLAHVSVTLAAGAGPGKVDKYAASLCLTPEPKVFNGVNYSWAYARTGGRADFQGFSLVVPAGVLDSPVGQWLTISPQVTPTPDLPGLAWPSADFSVLGQPWQDGGEHVYVTLPKDPGLAKFGPGFEPIVVHWNDPSRTSGEEITPADLLVDDAAGTVTTAVTHLSFLDSVSRAVQWPIEALGNLTADARFPAPSCDVSWALDGATGDWSHDGARIHLDSAFLNLPGNPVPPLGWPLKHCVESKAGSSAGTLRILNNSRTMDSLTGVYGNPGLGNVGIGGDPLQLGLAKAAELLTGHPVAYPGGEVTATVPVGSGAAVRMRPSVLLTIVWATLDQSPVKDLADKLNVSPVFRDLVQADASCVLSAIGVTHIDEANSPQSFADTLKSALESCFAPKAFFEVVAKALDSGLISSDTANGLSSKLDELSRLSIWLRVGQITFTGVDSLLNSAGGDAAGLINVDHYAPKPAFDAEGRPIQAQCIHAHGLTWTVDETCQNAVFFDATHPPSGSGGGSSGLPAGYILRDPSTGAAQLWNSDDHTIKFIDDGPTYLCLAKHYAVDWAPNLSLYQGTIIVSPRATCDSSIPDTRPIAPDSQQPPGPGQLPLNATILRQPDGTAWVVYDGVHRFHIPSGGEFICWVSPQTINNIKFYVWDQVTDAQLNQFTVDPAVTLISNCGDPTRPGF